MGELRIAEQYVWPMSWEFTARGSFRTVSVLQVGLRGAGSVCDFGLGRARVALDSKSVGWARGGSRSTG